MVDWGRAGPELLITLDRHEPLAVQIQDHLRAAIRDGRLAAGERLPSTRRLVEQRRRTPATRPETVTRGTVPACS